MALVTSAAILFTPHIGFANDQTELTQQQPMVEFDVYGLANAPFAVDGNTLLVFESWKKSITEYQLSQAGVWEVVQTIQIDSEGYDDGTSIFQLVGDTLLFTPGNLGVSILKRDDSGLWQTTFSEGPSGRRAMLDPTGERAITVSGRYPGPYTLEVQVLNSDGWSVQQQFSIPEYPWGTWCFGTDRFIVENSIYQQNGNGVWYVDSQLDTTLSSASSDCNNLGSKKEDGSTLISSFGIVGSPVQTQGLESMTAPYYRYAEAINDKHLAIFSDKDIAVFSKRTDNEWAFQGYVPIPTTKEYSPREIVLKDSLLFVSLSLPGSVTVFDLNQTTMNQSKSELPNLCEYGYSDTDGDGFGWEDQSCSYPQHYITAQNNRVGELLTTDQTYPQLPAEPLAFHENQALVLLSDVDTIELGLYTFDNQDWVLTESIDLTEDYLGLFAEYYRPSSIKPDRITAAIDNESLLVGFPRSALNGEIWSGRVLNYRRENGAWVLAGELERPDNVGVWNLFGNTMLLRSGELIVNSRNSGYVGGYESAFHTYLKNSNGDWSLQSQYWDERNTNASGKMGNSFSFDDQTLVTTSVNTIASYPIVEIYRRDANGGLTAEQVVSIDTSRASVVIDGDSIVIDDGGTLRILRRDNHKFKETATITGGKYLIYAGKLWETDVPVSLDDFEERNPTRLKSIFWDDDRSYYPVSINSIDTESESNTASDSTDNSADTTNSQDSTTQVVSVQDSDSSQSESSISTPSGSSGGGSVNLLLLCFLFIVATGSRHSRVFRKT